MSAKAEKKPKAASEKLSDDVSTNARSLLRRELAALARMFTILVKEIGCEAESSGSVEQETAGGQNALSLPVVWMQQYLLLNCSPALAARF